MAGGRGVRARKRRRTRVLAMLVGALALTASAAALGVAQASAYTPPPIRHVWVIMLENSSFDDHAHGGLLNPDAPSDSPYLTQVLPKQGNLLTQYWGTGHNSLDDYISIVSGQAPTPGTQSDALFCTGGGEIPDASPVDLHGQIVGQGCVYPSKVKTLFDQLTAHGLTWKGYMEGLSERASQEGTRCPYLVANNSGTDGYVSKHDPVPWFHSLNDDEAACTASDGSLYRLARDLQNVRTTPNFSFISPDILHDGHEGAYMWSADAFLRQYVPMIMSSAAYRQAGMIVVTWDEASTIVGAGAGQTTGACCNEIPGPNSPMPGVTGPGGGRTGAVVLSPYVKPGTIDDPTAGQANPTPPDACTPVVCAGPGYYNHYSFLRSMEDLFGIDSGGDDGHGHLGFAGSYVDYSGPGAFGPDVYNNWQGGSSPAPSNPSGGPTGPRKADGSATWQHPLPQGNDLRGVSCPTASACVAVGDGGALLSSADGGAHWSSRTSGSGADLRGVSCASATSCVAVGDGGTVVTSADGGGTWTSRTSGTSDTLRGVSCPAATTCVAVGDGGTVLRTDDSGATWTRQASGSQILYSVSCPSATTCYAVGDANSGRNRGFIVATTDGATWSTQTSGTVERLRAISCVTTTSCYAGGDADANVRTTNGGATWSEGSAGDNAIFAGASCPSAGVCFLAGWSNPEFGTTSAGGSVQVSTDGGGRYLPQRPNTRNPVNSISCPTTTSCVAVGARGTILRTSDGGVSGWASNMGGPDSDLSRVICWSYQLCAFEGMTTLAGISFSDSKNGFAVGSNDTIMATGNGGASWTTQKSGAPPPVRPPDDSPFAPGLNSVSCPASGKCFAVGDVGRVEATTNGGKTWSNQSSGTTNDLLGVSCPTNSTCLAAGSGGELLRTTNSGASWVKQSSGTSAALRAVSCTNASTCVAVGSLGTVLTTANAGNAWTPRSSGTTAYLAGISCSKNACLAVGAGGTVLRSADGGATWSAASSGVGDDLMSVSCSSATSCLATGSLGTVLSTANGGGSWSPQGTGTDRALRAASCPAAGRCFAAGDSAAILGIKPTATR